MLYVVVFSVSIVVASLVWLALLTWRAFRQVKALGSTVALAGERIGEATAAIETILPNDRS